MIKIKQWIPLVLGLYLAGLVVFAQAQDEKDTEGGLLADWKMVKDRKGVKVYMKHTEDSRLKTFLGVTEMSPQEPFSLVPITLDFENQHNIFHNVSQVELIETINPQTHIVRVHTLLPWPIKDREAVAKVQVVQDPETQNVRVNVDHYETDLPILSGYVRIPAFKGNWGVDLLDEGKTRVTYEFVLDPGGYVPPWLVAVVLKDAPYFTLQKIKGFIDRPEYQGIRYDFLSYPEIASDDEPAGTKAEENKT
jgi:hypothetical protein